jgi:type VI secretion system Hcp family effector
VITVAGSPELPPAFNGNGGGIGTATVDVPQHGAVSIGPTGKLVFPVLAFSLAPGAGSTGSGAGSGRRRHGTISITKQVDSASPKLLQALVTGESFKTVKLVIRRAGAGQSGTYSLTDVLISSVQQSSTGKGAQHPIETLTLNYQALSIQYRKSSG